MEVVCGVLFGGLPALRVPYVGTFWEKVRSDFPLVEEVPPIPAQLGGEEGISIQFEIAPQLPRTWMKARDDGSLLQLQRDRFLYNWKRPHTREPYPSYEKVIAEFERYWGVFTKFIQDNELGKIEPRQYELTYVNHIQVETVPAGDPVFIDHVRNDSRPRFLPPPAHYRYQINYDLPDGFGSLQISAGTSRSAAGETPIRLDMTARGMSGAGEPSAMRKWFDLAHDWIVNGFIDLTTERMQKEVWRRIS